MKLTGQQTRELQHALVSAFPSRMALEQFTQFFLGENLSVIAGGDTLADLVFSLLRWARLTDRIDELIREAQAANPANPELRGLAFEQAASQPQTTVILFLSADPSDAVRLRLGEELREIQERLQLAKLRERFRLDQRVSLQPTDLIQALLDVQPQIVHFSGHGSKYGELYLENQVGEAHAISPDALAALFEQFTNQVKCVVLNACYSEAQANEIARHIDYVIGMSQAIGDEAAIAFTAGFYQAIGAGRTIEEAHKLGCVQIRLLNIPEHLTPVLMKRVALAGS